MKKFKIRLPLELEQRSNFDRFDYSSRFVIEFDYQSEQFSLHGESDDYYIEMFNIQAYDEKACAVIVEKQVSDILRICSLIIQYQYSNQHYTHLRLTYNISKIEFLDEETIDSSVIHDDIIYCQDGLSLSYYGSSTTTQSISFNLYDTIKAFMDDKNFKFILDVYYRALEATDAITKFFNAFSAIEFLEINYVHDIQTHKLVDDNLIDKIIDAVNNVENAQRIGSRIKSVLSNATEENRASKLNAIIKLFGISKIQSGCISQEINDDFTKKIIEIRNSLFHGKIIDESMKNDIQQYTLKLILLLQCILCNWIS